jgi:bacterioferritin-associated ferredoxin
MNADDEVCLCFHVSLRKIRGFLEREDPPVASLVSECLGAGTGCQWCVPFLKHLHRCHVEGKPVDLKVSPEEYGRTRLSFHATRQRDQDVVDRATGSPDAAPPD